MTQVVQSTSVSTPFGPASTGAAERFAPLRPSHRKILVVNADDFGRSSDVNHAVLLAHREGILTSASLMVSGQAARQAVALARQTPSLAVGLHLVLADGGATLPAEQIPHLTDAAGRFRRSPARAGVGYFFNRAARRELQAEIRAQFEAFAQTGLELSHVDGHCHLHLHPVIFDMVLPLAEKHQARAVRIVQDGLAMSWQREREGIVRKLIWATEFAILGRRARKRLTFGTARHWPKVERTIGLMHSGNMTERYVIDALAHLPAGVSEMYFHPSLGEQTDRFGPGSMDLATLLSPAVRRVIEEQHIELATFPQVALRQGAGEFWQAGSGLLSF